MPLLIFRGFSDRNLGFILASWASALQEALQSCRSVNDQSLADCLDNRKDVTPTLNADG
jgi:hypothetical protein